MSGSLTTNAERLLKDVQRIHARMLQDLEQAMAALPGREKLSSSRPPGRSLATGNRSAPSGGRVSSTEAEGDVLDVPEFIP
jgi:hypothetical protein